VQPPQPFPPGQPRADKIEPKPLRTYYEGARKKSEISFSGSTHYIELLLGYPNCKSLGQLQCSLRALNHFGAFWVMILLVVEFSGG
jgi:hypothetical protein